MKKLIVIAEIGNGMGITSDEVGRRLSQAIKDDINRMQMPVVDDHPGLNGFGVFFNQNCRVGKRYPRGCGNPPGVLCDPVEGHFCTECESCEKFG